MLKFLKRESAFETIRAEELQVGDRFVYGDISPVVVLTIGMDDRGMDVIFDRTRNGDRLGIVHQVQIPRELLMTIVKR